MPRCIDIESRLRNVFVRYDSFFVLHEYDILFLDNLRVFKYLRFVTSQILHYKFTSQVVWLLILLVVYM